MDPDDFFEDAIGVSGSRTPGLRLGLSIHDRLGHRMPLPTFGLASSPWWLKTGRKFFVLLFHLNIYLENFKFF
jgi:hypothetical protein